MIISYLLGILTDHDLFSSDMKDLSVALIQTSLFWEDKQANLDMFASKIADIKADADLIVLPEMFTTGFSMKAEEFAEEMGGESVNWLREQAQNATATIVGSIIIKEEDKYYNRLIWIRPDGTFEHYDKRHLFRLANEQDHYTPGAERKIVELNGWRINLNICYDLRFPVWSRNVNDYDILLNVANWPAKRSLPWKTLLRARAIENMCYSIGLNRVGNDGNDFYHSGDSAIIHPSGETIESCSDEEKIITSTLSMDELSKFRNRFQFYKDADDFTIAMES